MNEIETSDHVVIETPPAQLKKKSWTSQLAKVIRDIVASTLWLYAPIKLFLYDIDNVLVVRFAPDWLWLLRYKFLLLIGTVAVIWLVTRSRRILEWFLYVAFFPFVILFWKIPRLVIKDRSWTLAIAIANMTISLLRSAKFKFIVSALFIVAFITILRSADKTLLLLAAGVILALLLATVIHRFVHVLRPTNEFGTHIKLFAATRQHVISSYRLDESTKELSVETLDQKQLEKWTSNLQMVVLFNRLCLLTAKKLREYHNSGIHIASHVASAMVLILMTALAFAAINLGLYKSDPSLFSVSSAGSLYDFFYYSFNGLLFRSVPEITPVAPLSQIVSIVESFLALFLVAIFASFFLAIKVRKSSEDLDRAITGIEEDGKYMESFIADEYRLSSIQLAVEQLQRLKAGMLKVIIQISKKIE